MLHDSHHARRAAHRAGFTLIELLVVISIIALLISVLLPALSQAREAGRSIACLSGLRQMGIAAAVYTDTYRGSYPLAQWYDHGVEWDLMVDSNGTVIPGLLWQGQGIAAIQQCPSFAGPRSAFDSLYIGYNYNTSYIGHGQGETVPAPARVQEIKNPGSCVLFGDGESSFGANKFMRAPFPHPGDLSAGWRWAGTQSFRHRSQTVTNALFADGHGQTLRDRFTLDDPLVGPGTGFLSEDNSLYDLE